MVLPWLQYASPQRFYGLAGRLYPLCFVLAALLGLAGLYLGFFVAPTDAQQVNSQLLNLAEGLVNRLNTRARTKAIAEAEPRDALVEALEQLASQTQSCAKIA